MTQTHLRRRRRGRCFSPEELRNGHQRADAAGMEYKLELWQTANGVGPFRGGGEPQSFGAITHKSDCGPQKGRGQEPHPSSLPLLAPHPP